MTREVVQCERCKLTQFMTASRDCRRCHKGLAPEENPPAPLVLLPPPVVVGGVKLGSNVRNVRLALNLSQRQLAARMGVVRTYVSKIENEKATPGVASLDRFARAFGIDITALLRCDTTAVLLSDPFIAELATYAAQLDKTQRSVLLNNVRELALKGIKRDEHV